ncbi:MAG: hypothetical protein GC172_08495 [Phycisphaera sp.]|nr:hypothetical protein [Phycisphaera sp.]
MNEPDSPPRRSKPRNHASSRGVALDVYDPEHFAIALSVEVRTVWECLRRMGPRTSIAALSAEMGWPIARLAPSLDRLVAAGVVSKARASQASKEIRYSVTTDRFEVIVDPADLRTKDVFNIAERAAIEHFFAAVANICAPDQLKKGDVSSNHMHFVSLNHEEVAELVRRVAHVADFLELQQRRAQRTPAGTVERCNYLVAVHLAPLVEPVLPIAHVGVRAVPVDTASQHGFASVKRALSERELLVARFLQEGYSRAEIAEKLGVSLATVHTYCKRVFKKLGIGRSADLQRVSLDARQDEFAKRSARLSARPRADANGESGQAAR